MPNIFITSDHHFNHASICKFLNFDGTPVRSFDNVNEMNEVMIDRWNGVVKPADKTYHIGDFALGKQGPHIASRLNGDKVLIKGNHDNFKLKDYALYFRDVRASHRLDNFILSHIPLHLTQLVKIKANIHGHLHNNIVYQDENYTIPDNRYFNVSVERHNYTPVAFEDIKKLYQ